MKLFPAIDIKDGRVVRLKYGDYQQMCVYDISPGQALQSFIDAGADSVHIVDLDGAKDGEPVNFEVISSLLQEMPLFTEIGGGIRTMATIDRYIIAGADRVILGTSAIYDQAFLEAALDQYGEKIAVGVDAREGRVAVAGWLQTTDIDSMEFCLTLKETGVKTVIYTDISRDGAMAGCNLAAYRRLSGITGLDITASGGISSLDEITALRDMNIYGAILGKALYNGQINLKEALALARGGCRE
jgi:phosphoribosylformimino-5-aminoimidazole carboxamide ribotide isomerase